MRARTRLKRIASICAVLTALLMLAVSGSARGNPADVVKELRPATDQVLPKDVNDVTGDPDGTVQVTVDQAAPEVNVGDPVVVPVSEVAPEGVLGKVTEIQALADGREIISSEPTTLGQAYSKFRASLSGKSLKDLVGASLSQLIQCSGAVSAKRPKLSADFGDLEPDLDLNIRRRRFSFSLSGSPRFGLALETTGKAECHYTGPGLPPIPIGGTPVVITIKPAMKANVLAAASASFTWSPDIEVGMEKKLGFKPHGVVHLDRGEANLDDFGGSAHASIFLGVNATISVAGRAGLEGALGPQLDLDLTSDSLATCIEATAAAHVELSAFADVFIKRWSFKIAEGSPPLHPPLQKCLPTAGSGVAVRSP